MGVEYGKLVSIVVPVYNVAPYLSQCLDSLIGQTYRNLEIILVDDGSTDTSGEICDEYAEQDERIRVLHKSNGGVSSARNAGIDMATGEYLIFVDSDDCIHRELINLCMLYEDKNSVLMYSITDDEKMLAKSIHMESENGMDLYTRLGFMKVFFQNLINSPVNKLYCLEIIRKNGVHFPENKSLGEDLLFNLDYLRYAPARYRVIHCPLYYYRENRDGSLSTSYRSDLFEIQQELFGAVETFLRDMDVWTTENQAAYFGLYWDRLYLTIRMCREYEKVHPEEHRLPELLESPVLGQIWEECGKRELLTWKRRMKRLHLKIWVFTERRK